MRAFFYQVLVILTIVASPSVVHADAQSETWEKDGVCFTASMLAGADFLSARKGYKVELKNSGS